MLRSAYADQRRGTEERAKAKRQRFLIEAFGRAKLEEIEERRREQHLQFLDNIRGCVKFFAKERREISAAAIAAFLDDRKHYPESEIANALDELRASDEYDRIVADASAAG